ncbi:trimeric intracellular cation channel family protein [Imtechella halotolerans]|uniref:Glycine transporter domain-containing protein n=1 Tax=Imtechella halotolerans K1 TaxID=946077 RepID=I0WE71_9FLAO|nr:trimeric intracellular cation channel family protein [Imtechella halotolerans]EID74687.1 hypothetical protein W5A_07902 [Imtechella halotolerans K1]WMQ64192.1 trimeric intracellular cation channel family protein [Imtechella halotolerans]
MFFFLDSIGTFVFAISGALAAMNKRLDPFGIFIIAFVTALGGGTLRDVLIGHTPVGWMENLDYVYIVIVGTLFAIFFRRKIDYLRKSLFLFDTIGLGVFTIIGIEKGIATDLHPIISVAIGTMSASFGGVIRDILCNEIPVIFRKEVYATACIVGGVFYFTMLWLGFPSQLIYVLTATIVIGIRLLAVKYSLRLPTIQ